jgi:hypothetical protein
MALILGTNAYIELASFKSWAALRNFDLASYSDPVIEAAIVIATLDFIEPNYKFLGEPLESDQPLKLPTDNVTISDIENPTAYTVLQYLEGNLFVDLTGVTNAELLEQTDKLGELSTTTKFREGSTRSYKKSTEKIDRLFNKFTSLSGFGLVIKRG